MKIPGSIRRSLTVVAVAVIAVAGSMTVAASASAATTTADPGFVTIDGVKTNAPVSTPEELEDFRLSAVPKVVTVEGDEIVSVLLDDTTPPNPMTAGSIIAPLTTGPRSPCASGDVCLGRVAPYSTLGFYGSGVVFGTWANVNSMHTGIWHASFCSGSSSLCVWSALYGPNTSVNFSARSIYGVEVRITA